MRQAYDTPEMATNRTLPAISGECTHLRQSAPPIPTDVSCVGRSMERTAADVNDSQ